MPVFLWQFLFVVVGSLVIVRYFMDQNDHQLIQSFVQNNQKTIDIALKVISSSYQTREELWQKAHQADTGNTLINVHKECFYEVLRFIADSNDYNVESKFVDLRDVKQFTTVLGPHTFQYRFKTS